MTHNHQEQQAEALSLFNRAFDLHENGQHHEAEEIYVHLLMHTRDNWYLHYHLALLLFETNRPEEALEHFLLAVSLNPSSNDLYYHLALCQKACGLYQQSVQSYLHALALDPDDTESRYNLANCYHELEFFEKAIAQYDRLLQKVPDHQSALNNIAYISHKAGQLDRAREYYERLLKVNPSHTSADHMVAALSGKSRSTVPLTYIKEVFDSYSAVYEQSLLDQLDYSLPTRLCSLVADLSDKHLFRRLLDLGCGTGLLGERFRNSATTLDGVDLSSKMIEIARNKNIYDRLITADIQTVLGTCKKESYDLILAADVFTYVGQLADIFKQTHRVAKPDCLFCFSVEDLHDQSADMTLQESGRFAHCSRYIKRMAVDAGWSIIHNETIKLRRERDGWIRGAVYALQKSIT